MLASISAFLPSALHVADKPPQPPNTFPDNDDDDDDGDPKQSGPMEHGVKKKKPNETFIFVRPPPAKSNHPLNLQVQLVPPNTKTPGISNRQSIDFTAAPTTPTAAEQDLSLDRTASSRSDASYYSSTASISSVGSTASTASARRMIIPLYSLQAHNVMTNIIVDTGTDAKIAKFLKRGLELIDLAILEPIEVWGAPAAPSSVDGPGSAFTQHTAGAYLLHPSAPVGSSRPGTPDPSHNPSPGSSHLSLAYAEPPPPSPTPVPAPAKRKLFGLFKKRDTPTLNPTTMPPAPRLSLSAAPPTPTTPDTPVPSLLRPPVLGIQPALSSPTIPPTGRPTMYVWIVRRWLKGTDLSLLSGMIKGAGLAKLPGLGNSNGNGSANGNANAGAPGAGVEVRFEWKRGKSKRIGGKLLPGSRDASRRASAVVDVGALPSAEKRVRRLSAGSRGSSTATSEGRSRSRDGGGGDESDPEDSETPWTCTLKVKRTGGEVRAEGPAPAPVLRVKVGTLSPTPHHPKVVAMLKVPFPLPDVEVERGGLRRRVVGPGGVMLRAEAPGGSNGPGVGLVLTAEEVKDAVCCTGLWLVVREGFGGVGKVSRKGDGWRIRA